VNEIIFNGKGCYSDFGVILNSFKPQPPAPKVIKEDVPFMNGSYDFSTVGSNGDLVYTERLIQCTLHFLSKSTTASYSKYSQLLMWLFESGKAKLIYTADTGVYYMAKVETVPSWDTFISRGGILQFEFIAEPFKQGIDLIGQELWDNINFETDVLQDELTYTIAGSKTISIYNPGRIVTPEVIVTANMAVTANGYNANFTTNKAKDHRFKIKNGYNTITVSGTGRIEFRFRKEVL
jgi:phage-related protein